MDDLCDVSDKMFRKKSRQNQLQSLKHKALKNVYEQNKPSKFLISLKKTKYETIKLPIAKKLDFYLVKYGFKLVFLWRVLSIY